MSGLNRGKITPKLAVKKLFSFLKDNRHADFKKWGQLDRGRIRQSKIRRSPSFFIKNRILCLKLPSWSKFLGKIDKKLIGFCLKNINKYDAIIIDVRQNQGGSSRLAHNFAAIFFDQPVVYGKFYKMGSNHLPEIVEARLEPDKNNFISKPIAILISAKCFSSCELFLAPFKVSKRAILIGRPTAGGSANPKSDTLVLSGVKYDVRIPTWRFFLKGQKLPIEKTKIHPDIGYSGKDPIKFAGQLLAQKLKS